MVRADQQRRIVARLRERAEIGWKFGLTDMADELEAELDLPLLEVAFGR